MGRRPTSIAGVVAALALVLAGAMVGQWHHAARAARVARAEWAARVAERERLARAVPAATSKGSAAVDEAVVQAEAELAAWRRALTGPSALAGEPATPLASWFEVTAAADRLRARGEVAGVALAPGESFAFASFRRQGPAEVERARVGRQRAVLETLLGTLFDAQPRALLSVQRERPDGSAGGEPADYFRMEPRLSVRAPGLLEATAFRFEFTGQTKALRTFLEGVVRSPDAVVIRSVEVAPVGHDGDRALRPASDAEPAPRPVIVPGLSRFVVTVEHVAPLRESAEATAEESDVIDQSVRVARGAVVEKRRWKSPAAQSAGEGWVFELFASPALHYDRLTGTFSVGPTHRSGAGPESLAVELLAVQREPFRLQLAGYGGAPGDWLGVFTSPGRAETLLARPGHRFEDLGLALKSLEVAKRSGGPAGEPPEEQRAGKAVLHDERAGCEVVLESRERLYTDTPLASLRLAGAGGPIREVREGETWADGPTRYRIERIQLDPPEVVIARATPGLPAPVTTVIRPAGAPGADGMRPDLRPGPATKRRSPPALATNP